MEQLNKLDALLGEAQAIVGELQGGTEIPGPAPAPDVPLEAEYDENGRGLVPLHRFNYRFRALDQLLANLAAGRGKFPDIDAHIAETEPAYVTIPPRGDETGLREAVVYSINHSKILLFLMANSGFYYPDAKRIDPEHDGKDVTIEYGEEDRRCRMIVPGNLEFTIEKPDEWFVNYRIRAIEKRVERRYKARQFEIDNPGAVRP